VEIDDGDRRLICWFEFKHTPITFSHLDPQTQIVGAIAIKFGRMTEYAHVKYFSGQLTFYHAWEPSL